MVKCEFHFAETPSQSPLRRCHKVESDQRQNQMRLTDSNNEHLFTAAKVKEEPLDDPDSFHVEELFSQMEVSP